MLFLYELWQLRVYFYPSCLLKNILFKFVTGSPYDGFYLQEPNSC